MVFLWLCSTSGSKYRPPNSGDSHHAQHADHANHLATGWRGKPETREEHDSSSKTAAFTIASTSTKMDVSTVSTIANDYCTSSKMVVCTIANDHLSI